MPERPQIRKELNEAFCTIPDLHAFLCDRFRSVYKRLPDGADRNTIITRLFDEEDDQKIWQEFQKHLKLEGVCVATSKNNAEDEKFISFESSADDTVLCAGISRESIIQRCWGTPTSPSLRNVELYCPWKYTQHESLAQALVRLAIHGGIKIFSVEDHKFWFSRHTADVKNCIGAQDHEWQAEPGCSSETSGWYFSESTLIKPKEATASLLGSHITGKLVADELNNSMNLWILDFIDREITWFMQDPLRFGVPYHKDYLSVITKLWPHWKDSLRNSPALLRHLLSCAMAHPDAPKSQASAGLMRAGPRTVKQCLLPALVFAMSIDAALASHKVQVRPKLAEHPGNFEMLQDDAHLVGLILINRQFLRLQHQKWGTSVVLLPHEQRTLRDLRNYRRIGSPPNELERLTTKSQAEVLITRDPDMIELLAQPPDRLGNYILRELNELKDRLEVQVAQVVNKSTGSKS